MLVCFASVVVVCLLGSCLVSETFARHRIYKLSLTLHLHPTVTGFGQGIAVRFVEEGAKVVLISRSPCDDTLKQIEAIDGFKGLPEDVALWVKGDISDEASCNAVAAASVARFGPHIDVLVNNAALFVFKSVEDATGEHESEVRALHVSARLTLFLCS